MRVGTANSTSVTIATEETGFCASLASLIQKIWDFFFSCCCPLGADLSDRLIQDVTDNNESLNALSVTLNGDRRRIVQELEARAIQRRNDLESQRRTLLHEFALLDKEVEINLEEGEYLSVLLEAFFQYVQSKNPQLSDDMPKNWLRCIYEKEGIWIFGGGIPMSLVFNLFKLDNAPDLTVSEYFSQRAQDAVQHPDGMIAGHNEALFWPLSENYIIEGLRYEGGEFSEVRILGVKESASILAKKAELEALKAANSYRQ